MQYWDIAASEAKGVLGGFTTAWVTTTIPFPLQQCGATQLYFSKWNVSGFNMNNFSGNLL